MRSGACARAATGIEVRAMKIGPIVPCLWFDDQAEAAARFYTQTFPDGRISVEGHYPETANNPSGKPPGSVLSVDFEVAGQATSTETLMSNFGEPVTIEAPAADQITTMPGIG